MNLYENYGKRDYCEIRIPAGEWTWCYSAAELQDRLTAQIPGQRVKAVYVGLYEYLQTQYSKTDLVDLSYTGGVTLLVFESAALALRLRGEGMAEYRILSAEALSVREISDYLPEDMIRSEAYFFDLARHDRTCDYAGKRVERVRVPRTTVWAMPVPGFDEERADEAGTAFDLPGEIYFTLEDGTLIRLIGDEYANYCILLERG